MNKKLIAIPFLVMFGLFLGCQNDDNKTEISSGESPILVETDTIEVTTKKGPNVTLSWTAASYSAGDPAELAYKVYCSTDDNLDTVASTEANGTGYGDFEINTTSKVVTGLALLTTYYCNVIVKGPDGYKALYKRVSFSTLIKGDIRKDGEIHDKAARSHSVVALSEAKYFIAADYFGGPAKFTVIDSEGNVIKALTNFDSNTQMQFSAQAKAEGSDDVFISFGDSADFSKGTLISLDGSNDWSVSAPTVYTTDNISIPLEGFARFASGKFITYFVNITDDKSGIVIHNADGSTDVPEIQLFDNIGEQAGSIAILPNDEAFIAATDYPDNYKGKFLVVDQTGAIKKPLTTFSSDQVTNTLRFPLTTSVLENGKVFLAYTENNKVKARFVDPNDWSMTNPVVYVDNNLGGLGSIHLGENYVLLAYPDEDDEKGKFMIIDGDGNVVLGPKVFSDVQPYNLGLAKGSDETVLIAYGMVGINGSRYVIIE